MPETTASFGRIFFGMPEKNNKVTLKDTDYEVTKSFDELKKYEISNEKDCISWCISSTKKLQLGETVEYNNFTCKVTKVAISTKKSELQYTYNLKPKSGIKTQYQYNPLIFGMSLPAVIKEVKGTAVRVDFAIEDNYNSSNNNKYFTYALESSGWYCMPVVDSKVNIHFPSKDEKEAIATNAVRTNSGGSKTSNPSVKSFSNTYGSEMKLDGSGINYSVGGGVNLNVNGDGSLEITGGSINLNAGGDLNLSGSSVSISAKEGVYVSKSATADVDQAHAVMISEEANILSPTITDEASAKNPPSVTFDDSALIAQDAAQVEAINNAVQQKVEEKVDGGKAKFGFGAIALAIGAAAIFCAAVVLTGGAAIAIAAVAGATAMAVGASEMSEGASDYTKGQSGDLSKSYNFMRDTVCGGNETLYNVVKYGSVCIAGGVVAFASGGWLAVGKSLTEGGFNTVFTLASDFLDDGKINNGLEYYEKQFALSMAMGGTVAKADKFIAAKNFSCAEKLLINTAKDGTVNSLYVFYT